VHREKERERSSRETSKGTVQRCRTAWHEEEETERQRERENYRDDIRRRKRSGYGRNGRERRQE